MSRKPREPETGRCRVCRRQFTYNANLPKQDICPEHYYEARGDYTGALEEFTYQLGYDAGCGAASASRDDLAEFVAKLIDGLPLRDLIALCHPDRHPEERRLQAHRATTALLELRTTIGARHAA